MFDPSDKVRVQEATDIVKLISDATPVKKKGKDYVCLCPFHNDRNPSMSISPTKQIYKCWPCGAGGDCFSWMMDYHKMTFPEAVEYLAERAGIKLAPKAGPYRGGDGGSGGDPETSASRDEIARANGVACEFFKIILRHPEHGAAARAVIEKRGVSPAMVERFSIGAAPDKWDGLVQMVEHKGLEMRPFVAAGLVKKRDMGGGYFDMFRHRLIFPIHNTLGQVVAFGGRRLRDEDNPKYLNSPESALFNKSATLYALPQAVKPVDGQRGIREEKCAVVVEGYMDAVACHQAGVCNVVATLGTALNGQGARVLARQCEKVVLMFDGDEAGQRAADRALEVLFGSSLDVRIATMSRAKEFGGGDAKDPDELVKQPGGGGAEVLRKIIAAGADALGYRFERLRATSLGLGVQAKAKLIEEEIQRLVDLGLATLSPVHKQMIVQRIATLAGVNEGVIREAIAKSRQSSRRGQEDSATGGETEPTERYRPQGARETALACILAEPVLLDELTVGQREQLAPGLFEGEIVKKLAGILVNKAFSAQTFTLSRIRSVVDDEPVVRAAQDFASEVAMKSASPDAVRRQLVSCLNSLDPAVSVVARDRSVKSDIAARLANLARRGAERPPATEG